MTSALRKPWLMGVIVLAAWVGCGETDQSPIIGPNQVWNNSFERGLDGWWPASDSHGGWASTSPAAAGKGSSGLVLYKGVGGWGSMVGQETLPHKERQTFKISARFKGAEGDERVYFGYHGQGFEVTATTRWQTVSRLVLLPKVSDDMTALISVVTDNTTVFVDEVFFALATVVRGHADTFEGNLLHNGSFESDLGLWHFWTDSSPGGAATTSPDAMRSGYAGLVLSKGPSGWVSSVRQVLPEAMVEGDTYRFEAHIKGTRGGEVVNLCLQLDREPWDGPCAQVTASTSWQHVLKTITIDASLAGERVGALVSLTSEGTVRVDDVVLVRIPN